MFANVRVNIECPDDRYQN